MVNAFFEIYAYLDLSLIVYWESLKFEVFPLWCVTGTKHSHRSRTVKLVMTWAAYRSTRSSQMLRDSETLAHAYSNASLCQNLTIPGE